jgi:hypothetical protein
VHCKKTVSLLINEKPGADVVALKSHRNCTTALRERINFIFIIPSEIFWKEYTRICITTSHSHYVMERISSQLVNTLKISKGAWEGVGGKYFKNLKDLFLENWSTCDPTNKIHKKLSLSLTTFRTLFFLNLDVSEMRWGGKSYFCLFCVCVWSCCKCHVTLLGIFN